MKTRASYDPNIFINIFFHSNYYYDFLLLKLSEKVLNKNINPTLPKLKFFDIGHYLNAYIIIRTYVYMQTHSLTLMTFFLTWLFSNVCMLLLKILYYYMLF